MFCYNCGKEVDDKAVICVHCGVALKNKEEMQTEKLEYREPKTAIGVVFALFLGLIGLLIGVLIYPAGTVARKTFMKAWLMTYLISIAVVVVMYVIIIFGVLGFAGALV